jgi:carbamoyltransferase
LPLCLAGGVALNCPMNTHLARAIPNAGVFVQPAAHDAGTALGAALEVAWMLGEPTAPRMQSTSLGPEYSDDAVEAALKRSGLSYRRVEDGLEETAQALAEHRVVARFQGRMEFGPRALGNRSLLANPILPETQKRLNRMKGRADWRPFGGIFRGEDCPRYFGVEVDSPFMLFTFDLQESERENIPVLVHVDGTTRPQIVTSEREPDLHRLVGLFEERTGAGAVVNTSFNRGGEPIVCSPDDALASFRGLGADALHLGSFWVEQ